MTGAALDQVAGASGPTILPDVGLRCGADLVDLAQFRRDVQVGGDRFLRRIYAEAELASCGEGVELLASRFAAKEAVAKALGSGIRGIGWKDIEVDLVSNGESGIRLHGRAKERAAVLGIGRWALSVTNTASVALAIVIAEPEDLSGRPTG
jgi:holo-[acyl-carrier protein] synthase